MDPCLEVDAIKRVAAFNLVLPYKLSGTDALEMLYLKSKSPLFSMVRVRDFLVLMRMEPKLISLTG